MTLEQRATLALKKASPNMLKPSKQSWTILVVDDGILGIQLTSLPCKLSSFF